MWCSFRSELYLLTTFRFSPCRDLTFIRYPCCWRVWFLGWIVFVVRVRVRPRESRSNMKISRSKYRAVGVVLDSLYTHRDTRTSNHNFENQADEHVHTLNSNSIRNLDVFKKKTTFSTLFHSQNPSPQSPHTHTHSLSTLKIQEKKTKNFKREIDDWEEVRTVYLGCTTTSDMYISNSPLVSTLPLRLDDELSLLILLTLIFSNSKILSLSLSLWMWLMGLRFSFSFLLLGSFWNESFK